MARKKSPFIDTDPRRGAVVAVEVQPGLWCYVRHYLLSHAFLPFFSRVVLAPDRLPTLRAERHFDLWCYDSEPTPMQFIGRFPFESDEEACGEPYYTPPDAIENIYIIHEACGNCSIMRRTADIAQVQNMRRQRRYQPHEFHLLIADMFGVWPIVDDDDE